jgi:hypothetical protein
MPGGGYKGGRTAAAKDAVEVKVSGDDVLEDTEVDEDGLLSGVFLFSEEAKGWHTLGRLLESAMSGEEPNLGCLA